MSPADVARILRQQVRASLFTTASFMMSCIISSMVCPKFGPISSNNLISAIAWTLVLNGRQLNDLISSSSESIRSMRSSMALGVGGLTG